MAVEKFLWKTRELESYGAKFNSVKVYTCTSMYIVHVHNFFCKYVHIGVQCDYIVGVRGYAMQVCAFVCGGMLCKCVHWCVGALSSVNKCVYIYNIYIYILHVYTCIYILYAIISMSVSLYSSTIHFVI